MLPLSRREILQVGGIGLFGLTLPQLLFARSKPATKENRPQADACILVFLAGGPSHLDMWDMKPDAPLEIRGPFKPIATSVRGVQLCEHLPCLAKQMHHCTLVRSMHHVLPNHVPGIYQALTGHARPNPERSSRPSAEDYPAIGSVLASRRSPRKPVVPFVWLADAPGASWFPQSGYQGGWLSPGQDPYLMPRNPNEDEFDVPELAPPDDRFAKRRQLLDQLDDSSKGLTDSRPARQMKAFQEKAFELLAGANTRHAFQIGREPESVREAYGRDGVYGQRLLMARRLIEAGVRMVCVAGERRWDTHDGNFGTLKRILLPDLDAALSSLIADLAGSGLLGRTLVAVMGEFGRTPRIGQSVVCGAGKDGRDHWSQCYSLLMAGGGIKRGFVHGSSDKIGATPKDGPVTPADLVATIYHCLGISPDLEVRDTQDRPTRLVPWGEAVTALLA